jgi:hypothetical protein
MSYLGDRCTPGSGPLLPPATGQKQGSGNLLTQTGSPTIVLREFRMNSSPHCSGTFVALRRYRCVCFVLVALLLFNPFFVPPRSGNGLEVCHPASHRATVGSSELQHFSPADGWDNLAVVDSTEAAIVLFLPDLTAQFFLVLPSVPLFAQQVSGPGLWFRPPPVR